MIMPLQLFQYPDGAAAFYMTVLTFLPVPAQRAGAEFIVIYAMLYLVSAALFSGRKRFFCWIQKAPLAAFSRFP